MPNENADNSNLDPEPENASEAEILLSRLVDQQATEQDQHRFEQLAVDEPSLWRTLAQQQQEMAALSDTVIEQLVAADCVELNVNTSISRASTTTFRSFAYTGWAAAILIAAVWMMLPAKESSLVFPQLTSDDHFNEYLGANFVEQELDPVLMDKEELEDGRFRVWIMRRVEESFIINRPPHEITDEDDKLTVSPEVLRNETPQPQSVSDQ